MNLVFHISEDGSEMFTENHGKLKFDHTPKYTHTCRLCLYVLIVSLSPYTFQNICTTKNGPEGCDISFLWFCQDPSFET